MKFGYVIFSWHEPLDELIESAEREEIGGMDATRGGYGRMRSMPKGSSDYRNFVGIVQRIGPGRFAGSTSPRI